MAQAWPELKLATSHGSDCEIQMDSAELWVHAAPGLLQPNATLLIQTPWLAEHKVWVQAAVGK
jgi:hypothetical protein